MLILSITQACHEKWEEMTPADRGVFCQSCSKHVIDFSAMADEDILDYFQKREGQPVCGRFRNSQLNRPLIDISPSVFSMDIPLWKKFLAAVFICFSTFITGCSTSDKQTDYTALQVPPSIEQPAVPAKEVLTNKVDSAIQEQPSTAVKKQSKKKSKQKYFINENDWIVQNGEMFLKSVKPVKNDFVLWGFTTSTPVNNNQTILPVTFPVLKKTKTIIVK